MFYTRTDAATISGIDLNTVLYNALDFALEHIKYLQLQVRLCTTMLICCGVSLLKFLDR